MLREFQSAVIPPAFFIIEGLDLHLQTRTFGKAGHLNAVYFEQKIKIGVWVKSSPRHITPSVNNRLHRSKTEREPGLRLMVTRTNSAGRSGATPISVTTCPSSTSSGVLVSSSHFTKKASFGLAPAN